MNIKNIMLLMFAVTLSATVQASECVQCNEGLIKDRAHLELLASELRSFGVQASAKVKVSQHTSRMEEHAVLKAKIIHFQQQLHELAENQ